MVAGQAGEMQPATQGQGMPSSVAEDEETTRRYMLALIAGRTSGLGLIAIPAS
jgi:hypothetical protein